VGQTPKLTFHEEKTHPKSPLNRSINNKKKIGTLYRLAKGEEIEIVEGRK